MTDGIIQEVFRKYWHNEIKNITELEKELIEKIKQEFKAELNCGCDICENANYYYNRLIGDNE